MLALLEPVPVALGGRATSFWHDGARAIRMEESRIGAKEIFILC